MKKNNTFKIIMMSLCVVFNILGSFLAVALKLPIYIDTIGTFLAAFLFGPIGGMLTGGATSIIAGISFDPMSLYFIPVQLVIGCFAGVFYKKNLFAGKFIPVGVILVTVISSIVASVIAAFVFGGITSSGSSIIVMYLKEAGVNLVTSVFSTQILTDILDKSVAVMLVLGILKTIPASIKEKYSIFKVC